MTPGKREQRKDVRLPVKRTTASGFSGQDTDKLPVHATVMDISEGGVRIQFGWPAVRRFVLNPGDGLGFRLRIDGSRDAFDLWSVVRHVAVVSGQDTVRVGVQFSGVEGKLREQLKQVLQNLAVTALRTWHTGRTAESAAAAAAPSPGHIPEPEAEPHPEIRRRRLYLGEILVKQGKLDQERLSSFMSAEFTGRLKLGEELAEKGLVTDSDIARALAEQAKLGFVDLSTEDLTSALELATKLPREAFSHSRCVPLRVEEGVLLVAAAAPPTLEAFEAMKTAAGRRVRVLIAADDQIHDWLKRLYNVTEMRRTGGISFAVQLHVEYRAFRPGETVQPGTPAGYGLTKEISRRGMTLAGPLPPGITREQLTAGGVKLIVQASCPELTLPLTMVCTPLEVESSEYRDEFVVRCAIDEFRDEGETAWHRICLLRGTIRFRRGVR